MFKGYCHSNVPIAYHPKLFGSKTTKMLKKIQNFYIRERRALCTDLSEENNLILKLDRATSNCCVWFEERILDNLDYRENTEKGLRK